MKLTKTAKLFYLAMTITMTLLMMSCKEIEAPTSDDSETDDIGTLIDESEHFTHFAILIAIADREVPDGERGIMEMLKDKSSNEVYNIFAPSDAVFESLAEQWSTEDYKPSVEEVIGEFTHSGQPAKTRDFVLGHIFRTNEKIESSRFDQALSMISLKGVAWMMVASDNSESGFAFVLESNPSASNPYPITETDLLIGSNGIVHAALVN